MKPFQKYAEQLDGLLDKLEWGGRVRDHLAEVETALNGEAAQALRKFGRPDSIRRHGAYFTSQELADFAIRPIIKNRLVLRFPVYDPTCGAGDLLLRWAGDLPVSTDLRDTLDRWQPLLQGHDLFPEFLGVAKRRLVLKAIAKGARLKSGRPPKVDALFRRLQEGDVRSSRVHDTSVTFLVNPPFGSMIAPKDCQWSSGKVSLAAVLFESILRSAAPKTRLVAILPDVLRTGSRYARWRDWVSKRLRIARVQRYGRFDSHADIDVFILEAVVGNGRPTAVHWWTEQPERPKAVVADLCDLSVGAVVPHRDPDKGSWAPFATSKTIPVWQTVSSIKHHRRFDGTKVQPPFVAVRRTSSPGDAERAIGSVVACDTPVAVENHLLVLKPKSGGIHSCEAILKNLKDARTKAWLDERIRCRHLTVGALRDLPIWEPSK